MEHLVVTQLVEKIRLYLLPLLASAKYHQFLRTCHANWYTIIIS